jgi:hypothetical protein
MRLKAYFWPSEEPAESEDVGPRTIEDNLNNKEELYGDPSITAKYRLQLMAKLPYQKWLKHQRRTPRPADTVCFHDGTA